PFGMAGLAADGSELMPWAWGINGCASVVGAVLATLVSVHLGITRCLLRLVSCMCLLGPALHDADQEWTMEQDPQTYCYNFIFTSN
ncbi:MAG: hypothetical protein ACREYE_01710, partial [Gammaproteobacteria bacterium]